MHSYGQLGLGGSALLGAEGGLPQIGRFGMKIFLSSKGVRTEIREKLLASRSMAK